jgi:hypothetical protein
MAMAGKQARNRSPRKRVGFTTSDDDGEVADEGEMRPGIHRIQCDRPPIGFQSVKSTKIVVTGLPGGRSRVVR